MEDAAKERAARGHGGWGAAAVLQALGKFGWGIWGPHWVKDRLGFIN